MYKYIIGLLLIVSTAVKAQTSKLDADRENFFRFGAKAGLNANKISGNSYKKGFNYNYQLGGFLQFNFSPRFGIQPELNFLQGTSEFTDDPTIIYDDLFAGNQRKATLNYLEVPLLLNINLGPSKRVKAQIGPAYGGLVKQTIDSLKTKSNIYKNGEWSAIGGIWFQLPLINVGARYKLGLSNINAIDNKESWKSQALQLFVGVTF
jgi:hypothetical protein